MLEGDESAEAQAMRDKLARKEAAAAKANKATPSPELELSGLLTAQAKFAERPQVREDRVKSTAEAATKRRETRHSDIVKMKAQLDDFGKLLSELESKQREEYSKRAETRAEFQRKVNSIYEERISALRKKVGNPPPSAPAVATRSEVESQQATNAAMQQQHAAQLRAMQEQIANMQRQQAAQDAQNRALREEAVASECFLRFVPDVKLEDVPVIATPGKELLAKYGQAYELLVGWRRAGESVPFSFNDLISHTSFASDIALTMRATLGETLWKKWFAEDPAPTTTVPKQITLLFLGALERLKQSWENEQAVAQQIAAESANAYVELCGTVKKRRAQAMDIAMA